MYFLHPLADVLTSTIGDNTNIWQFTVVLSGAQVGADCNICSHCFIENDVCIGDRVTIKNGVQLWDGLRVMDDVFIGPNVTFTNDIVPRSKKKPATFLQTIIKQGASIGANATILPGIILGENSLVAAGAVVTQNVPPNSIVKGVPARITGYTNTQILDTKYKRVEHRANLNGPVLYTLPKVKDSRGDLVIGEFSEVLPFSPKRMFMIHHVPSSEVRGAHAHKECHQFLIATHGSVNVIVDDGQLRTEYELSDLAVGLYIRPGVWGIQYKYSADAVLLVLASHNYNSDDYIRDYNDFLKWKGIHSRKKE